MKTKLLLISLLSLGLTTIQAQNQTTVYAKNSDISDNLDLRAVASMFGESANLQDFERRLNDPKYQISNLDLNNDNQVDYLRVIESVENRTHVVIIQSVLDRDVYQDIATIDIERDNYNKVSVQVVGNTYLYGENYIYEPVYNVTPIIYTSFWVTNYRPYYSTWGWNIYPNYYVAWRPYPIYRYRSNINVCINVNNHYNYVNYRRSSRAMAIYEPRRSYGYEKQHPNYSFSQRNSNANNRYDLDQRRVANRGYNNNSHNVYNSNRNNSDRVSTPGKTISNRDYAENRTNSNRDYNTNRTSTSNSNSGNSNNNPVRINTTPRTESSRNYNENSINSSRGNSENRMNTNRTVTAPQTATPRNYSENRATSAPRTESPRNYSENRNSAARPQNTQRSEAPRVSQESRGSQPQRESGSTSRNNGGRRI